MEAIYKIDFFCTINSKTPIQLEKKKKLRMIQTK